MYSFIMSHLALVLLAAMTVCAQEYQIIDGKPSFCNHLECPLFQVIENDDVYELREYEAILWVQTRVHDMEYKKANFDNYMRLRNYISGANEEGRMIDMTVPVIRKISLGNDIAFANDFSTSFFLTQNVSLFDTFPRPTNENVSLTRTPKLRAFVRSFPGYVTSYDTYREEAQIMMDAIDNSTRYIIDYFYTAGYNSPFDVTRRHNEVWFIAKEIMQD